MASTSETGHNKNVANFSSAYQILEEMGAIYNPSNTNLLLANLQPKKSFTWCNNYSIKQQKTNL